MTCVCGYLVYSEGEIAQSSTVYYYIIIIVINSCEYNVSTE